MKSEAATTYRPSNFVERIALALHAWKETFKATDGLGKAGMAINLPLPGLGSALLGRLEKGLLAFLAYFFVWFLAIYVGIQKGVGIQLDDFSLAILYLVLILALGFMYVSAFLTSIEKGYERAKDPHRYYLESFFQHGLSSLYKRTKKYFAAYLKAYEGGTKKEQTLLLTSWFIMGVSELGYRQFVRGLVYLLSEAGVIIYLILRGFYDIGVLFRLDVLSSPNGAFVYGIIAIFLVIYLVFAYFSHLRTVLSLTEAEQKGKAETPRGELSSLINDRFSVVGLTIPVLGAIAFTIIPITFMILTAFTNYSLKTVSGYENYDPHLGIPLHWSGLEAFERLFANSSSLVDMVNVFGWTIVWATVATFTCYFGGLLLALLLNKKAIKGKVVYRSIFVVAMALPQFVSLLVVRSMFDRYGIVNNILLELGWLTERFDFWSDGTAAKILILVVNMWVGIPYYMLLMSGLLLNIPKDQYEAADIEGATGWQKFTSITFPEIFFMTTPVLITSFVNNINNFNVIWFLTGGGTVSTISGTAGNTDILITWLYKLTFQAGASPDYNLAAVVGIIMFVISATCSLVIFQRSKAYRAEEEYR